MEILPNPLLNWKPIISGDKQEEKTKLINEISMLQQQLQYQFKEYKTILQMAIIFFKNIQEVYFYHVTAEMDSVSH